MKHKILFAPAAAVLAAVVLAGGGAPQLPHRDLIDGLDAVIQKRFAAPEPSSRGMSRVAEPRSFGTHYLPQWSTPTDFRPESLEEFRAIGDLESRSIRVGLYVFGAAILRWDRRQQDFRALKGPAAITPGTVRPSWYPSLPEMRFTAPRDALPDWTAIHPIARAAMKRFAEGGKSFEAELDGWTLLARPVPASAESCVGCHNNPNISRSPRPIALHDAIGGVLYGYR